MRMQGILFCITDEFWLRKQLVREWERRQMTGSEGHRRSHHFGEVTECFLAVAANPAAGGTTKQPDFNVGVCAWMAAILTAMLHVSGMPRPPATCTAQTTDTLDHCSCRSFLTCVCVGLHWQWLCNCALTSRVTLQLSCAALTSAHRLPANVDGGSGSFCMYVDEPSTVQVESFTETAIARALAATQIYWPRWPRRTAYGMPSSWL